MWIQVTDKSLNSFRVLSMISYSSCKRPSASVTPDNANSVQDAIVIPPKKIKFNPDITPDNLATVKDDSAIIVPTKKLKYSSDNLENLDPNSGTTNEKIYKPLTVLGESNLVTRRKIRKQITPQCVPRVFEIIGEDDYDEKKWSSGEPSNLDPFVERLPSSLQRNRCTQYEDIVYFCTPPGPNSRCYPNTSYLSVESLDERGQNQDESANYCDTVYFFPDFFSL